MVGQQFHANDIRTQPSSDRPQRSEVLIKAVGRPLDEPGLGKLLAEQP
jgi:hypothetical protein